MLWLLLLVLGASQAAFAYDPVSSINGVTFQLRRFNDDSDSIVTTVNNYPSYIKIQDSKLDGDGTGAEWANRHAWFFSNDGGATRFQFANHTYFELFADVTVTGDAAGGKDHEAGFFFDLNGWDGQMMVNTNGQIAAFGYVLPYYAFLTPYSAGSTVRIGMKYFYDAGDGKNKIKYYAGNESSPALGFGNSEDGIIDGTNIGGYGQFQIAPNVESNFGRAEWGNITIVPEPASILVLASGLCGLLIRRRK